MCDANLGSSALNACSICSSRRCSRSESGTVTSRRFRHGRAETFATGDRELWTQNKCRIPTRRLPIRLRSGHLWLIQSYGRRNGADVPPGTGGCTSAARAWSEHQLQEHLGLSDQVVGLPGRQVRSPDRSALSIPASTGQAAKNSPHSASSGALPDARAVHTSRRTGRRRRRRPKVARRAVAGPQRGRAAPTP